MASHVSGLMHANACTYKWDVHRGGRTRGKEKRKEKGKGGKEKRNGGKKKIEEK